MCKLAGKKIKHSVLLTDATGEVMLVYTFSKEEYSKVIVALKHGKAASIDETAK